MKILHCADIHLDSAMTANLDKDKAKERKSELLASFKDMVAYAVKENIRVIIIAGDLFDTRNISVGAKKEVYNIIINNPDISLIDRTNRGDHPEGSVIIQIPDHLSGSVYLDQLRVMSFRSLSVMALPVTDIQTTVPFREQLGNKEKLGSLDIVLIHLANDISSLEIQLYEAMGITASDQIITVIQRSHAKRVTVYFHAFQQLTGRGYFPDLGGSEQGH